LSYLRFSASESHCEASGVPHFGVRQVKDILFACALSIHGVTQLLEDPHCSEEKTACRCGKPARLIGASVCVNLCDVPTLLQELLIKVKMQSVYRILLQYVF